MTRHGYGRMLFFIVYVNGILNTFNPDYYEEITSMSSFVDMEIFLKIGQKITPTVDCFTFGGMLKLFNTDLDSLIGDYER
eukprot:gene12303-16500_t